MKDKATDFIPGRDASLCRAISLNFADDFLFGSCYLRICAISFYPVRHQFLNKPYKV